MPGQVFPNLRNPQVAYHGTSLLCAVHILQDDIKVGPSATENKPGCYFERELRKANAFWYASHMLFKGNRDEAFLTACVFEAMVDRTGAQTASKFQWVQQPGTFIITGVYTHQISYTQVFTKGYCGWMRIHGDAFKMMTSMLQEDWYGDHRASMCEDLE